MLMDHSDATMVQYGITIEHIHLTMDHSDITKKNYAIKWSTVI